MANCNCNDFPISCAPHAPGGDCCHQCPPHGCPPHPCPPPAFKGGTSMYIGARYVPIFADPVEWDDVREYEPLTIVIHNGDCYTSKCYVPKGAQLPPYPDGQTKYWVKTSDYNYQFADLKKTVTDLSRLVEQFQKDNENFTKLINGWNAQVQQWGKDMAAWGERLDTVESTVSDLTDSLNAEIARAKAAEQENAAAIAKETTDRQQAISELDAAYKAADATEAQTRSEADTALSNRITANKTDIDAIKAEQAIQNTNISNNAKNISDNSAEIAKHAKRLTDLESNASDWDSLFPDTTIAQEMQKEEAARANGDTALNGRCDAIAADVEEVRDIANHKVDTTTYTAGQAAQDAKITAAQNDANKANATIGDWNTEHPGKTISQAVSEKPGPGEYLPVMTNEGDKYIIAADIKQDTDIPGDAEIVVYSQYGAGARYPLESVIPPSTPVFDTGMAVPITGPARMRDNKVQIMFPLFHQYRSRTFTLKDSRNMSGTLFVYKFKTDAAPTIQSIPYTALSAAYDGAYKCLRVSFTPDSSVSLTVADSFFIISARDSENAIFFETIFD